MKQQIGVRPVFESASHIPAKIACAFGMGDITDGEFWVGAGFIHVIENLPKASFAVNDIKRIAEENILGDKIVKFIDIFRGQGGESRNISINRVGFSRHFLQSF
jgi:hypothetical protein